MTPSSRAAVAAMSLNVLPGEYVPWMTRFMRGVCGSRARPAQTDASIPVVNSFGS
jgi:hypothetical protein